MTELDIESDAFLLLLTDALRSGPGSPSWHQALAQLRERGTDDSDDYQLLVSTREHLESGKGYRAIRAGPGFTQRLMAEIEQESPASIARPATTTAIALACAAVMLVVILSIGYLLKSASDVPLDTSSGGVFINTVASIDMKTGPAQPWRAIGGHGLQFDRNALRSAAGASETSAGGGFVWDHPIRADEPVSMAVTLRVRRPQERLIPQLFVTDDPQFNDANATTQHEFVWLLQNNESQVVLPTGRIETQSTNSLESRNNMVVRLTIDHDQAFVDIGKRRFWTGAHLLADDKPRYVGIRLLRKSGDVTDEEIAFSSVQVNMRAP
ncbi:MAG TPA: hypothetical protein VHD56_04855 [Tepidisphaeraceae bacterium]|nr:hypothetical protein [Tepidisphaeraceae bacterium]